VATSRLEIDLSAVERNLGVVRGVIGGPKGAGGNGPKVAVCAVLKQDGYGLGAARLAKRLVGTGVEMIAVYTLDEARAIADAVGSTPILVLMPVPGIDRMDPVYRHVTSGRIHLTLHSEDQLKQITEMTTRIGTTLPVHVQVDTGLSRGGAMPEQAHALVQKMLATPRVKLAGLMTHFSSPCCDAEFTREQAKLFRDFVEGIKPVLKAAVAAAGSGKNAGGVVAPHDLMLHAANSCAMFRARNYHGTMVRVGQALLGYALEEVAHGEQFEFAEAALRLEPAVRWTSTVAHISEIPAGWPVGYGSAWRAPWRTDGKKTRIALVPVGYADGYPRSLGGKPGGGPGWVGFTGRSWERRSGGEPEEGLKSPRPMGGESAAVNTPALPTVFAPVVGRVSMDQITVDVTDVPEAYLAGVGRMEAGPEVELFGRDRAAANFVSTLAAEAHSITHELMTRVGPRVERVYRYPAVSAGGGTVTATGATSGAGEGAGRGGTGAVAARVVNAPTPGDEQKLSGATGMAAFQGG
jgi:alanine racemase